MRPDGAAVTEILTFTSPAIGCLCGCGDFKLWNCWTKLEQTVKWRSTTCSDSDTFILFMMKEESWGESPQTHKQANWTHTHRHTHILMLWSSATCCKALVNGPPGGVNQYMSLCVCVCKPFENNTVCVCGHKWGAMALREAAEFWLVPFHDALTSNIDVSSICLPEFICRLSLVQFPFCLSYHTLSGLLSLSSYSCILLVLLQMLRSGVGFLEHTSSVYLYIIG